MLAAYRTSSGQNEGVIGVSRRCQKELFGAFRAVWGDAECW